MKFLYDIRAEVWIANCYQNATTPVEVQVRPKGTFSRAYSPDVLNLETHEADAQHPLTHVLDLSREGLYDMLPETLHHLPTPPLRAGRDEARAMLDQSKRLRHEENEARTFWMPFEQESFRQRVQIEAQEAQALTHAYGAVWDELQNCLWGNLPIPLSVRQRACLLATWTNAYRIVGDWEGTAFYLSEFLQVPVQVQYGDFGSSTESALAGPQSVALGNAYLGQDWILNTDYLVDEGGTVRLQIGPLRNDQLSDFLPDGIGLRYVRLLADYLLPADADWELEIEPDEQTSFFRLSDGAIAGRLGLTTWLSN